MKKFIALSIFFFFSLGKSFSQITFEKSFIVNSSMPVEKCNKTEQLKNGNYIATGANDGCFFCPTLYYLRLLNPYGDTLWQQLYVPGDNGVPPDFCLLPDSTVAWLLGDQMQDSTGVNTMYLHLIKINLNNGIVLSDDTINLVSNTGVNIYSLLDSTVNLISGNHLVKLDINLDTIFHKYSFYKGAPFQSANQNGFYMLEKIDPTGSDSALLVYYNNSMDSISILPFSTSTYYQFFHLLTGTGWAGVNFNQDNTGAFYFNAVKYPNLDSLAFVKCDSALNILWQKYYGGNFNSVLPEGITSNSTYVTFTGGVNHTSNPTGDGFIYKIKLNGDSVFFKTYKCFGHYEENKFYYVANCFDGGYILSGTTFNYGTFVPYSSWIIKTDSLGNTPFNTSISELQLENTISISPNPFTNKISLHPFNSSQEKISISIFNSLGEKLFVKESTVREQEINLSQLPSGIYLLTIKTEKTFFTKKIVKM